VTRPRALFAIATCVAIAAGIALSILLVLRVPAGVERDAKIGGPFDLISDTGERVTEAALAGKPTVMYFGYTYCPEVCPTTLFDLSQWIEKLGREADELNYIFVTVDPERDTPSVMHAYLSSFDKRIRGFTGTPEQIAKIAEEYGVSYRRVPSDDGGYLIDHSAVLYLIGPNGKFVDTIGYQEETASAISKLQHLIKTR